MDAKPRAIHVDEAISRLARRQHGVVGRWQLAELGVTREQLAVRRKTGRLKTLHRGVYLVGAVPPVHAHEMAALLAYRLKAVLSHWTAASLWELRRYQQSAPVWVTLRPEREATRPTIKAVRAALTREDIRKRNGMWVTSPARTILDMASQLDNYELEHLVSEAQYRWKVTERDLSDQIDRNRGRKGIPSLGGVLSLPGGPQRTRSGGERALLRLLRTHGITGFEANARIAGYEVDFLWRSERVALELDGYDGHSSRQAFERDRLKWSRLQAAGIRVIPITARQLREDPDAVIARLTATLTNTSPRS